MTPICLHRSSSPVQKFLFLLLLLPNTALSLSALIIPPPRTLVSNRHVCLFHSYEAVRGPHFAALLDQLWEQTGYDSKRTVFITSSSTSCNGRKNKARRDAALEQIQHDLDLEVCHPLLELGPDQVDPEGLRNSILACQPSIVWVASSLDDEDDSDDNDDDDDNDGDNKQKHNNAYWLRHLLRIHNVDGIIHELCGPAFDMTQQQLQLQLQPTCLFVGQGAGALCAGANMAVAALRGDNPRVCPELQVRGLQLLGPHRSVSFEKPRTTMSHPEGRQQQLQALQNRLVLLSSQLPLYNADDDEQTTTTLFLNRQQVYVFSQQLHEQRPVPVPATIDNGNSNDSKEPSMMLTTSLIMNPYQKGAIEQYQSASLEPVPPLSFTDTSTTSGATCTARSSSVAQACTGEPSEDPSRTIYTTTVEEGDYC